MILQLWSHDPPYEIDGKFWKIQLEEDRRRGDRHRLHPQAVAAAAPADRHARHEPQFAEHEDGRAARLSAVRPLPDPGQRAGRPLEDLRSRPRSRPAAQPNRGRLQSRPLDLPGRHHAGGRAAGPAPIRWARTYEYIGRLFDKGLGRKIYKRDLDMSDADCNLDYLMTEQIIAGDVDEVLRPAAGADRRDRPVRHAGPDELRLGRQAELAAQHGAVRPRADAGAEQGRGRDSRMLSPAATEILTEPVGSNTPWAVGDLIPPPPSGWRQTAELIGPGVVVAGSAVGAGEWLFGPAVTAQYGGTFLWLATLSIALPGCLQPGGHAVRPLLRRAGLHRLLPDPARPAVLDALLHDALPRAHLAVHGLERRRPARRRRSSATCRPTAAWAWPASTDDGGQARQGARLRCLLSPPSCR